MPEAITIYVDTCFADGVHGVRLSSGFVANDRALITVYRLAVRNLLLNLMKRIYTGREYYA